MATARRLKSINIQWEIPITLNGHVDVTVVLPITQDCADQGAICTWDGRMLSDHVMPTVASLSLDDFDAGGGQTVLASALIQVGNRGRKNSGNRDCAWYASDTSAWHDSGKLRDGSIAWNGMTLTRVVYYSETGVFRLNEADDVHIGDSFDTGGANREVKVRMQPAARAVSLSSKDHIMNSGAVWTNFEVPTGIRSALARWSKDVLVIVAVSPPENP